MAARRLATLQRRMVHWLAADGRRTNGGTSSSHGELLRALRGEKRNISQSLRTLEARGLMVIERSPGGQDQRDVMVWWSTNSMELDQHQSIMEAI